MFGYTKLAVREWFFWRRAKGFGKKKKKALKKAQQEGDTERAKEWQKKAVKKATETIPELADLRIEYRRRLISVEQRRALKLGIATPRLSPSEADPFHDSVKLSSGETIFLLSAKGLAKLRNDVRAEKEARWESRRHMFAALSGIGTFLAGITGVIGALIGLFAVAC